MGEEEIGFSMKDPFDDKPDKYSQYNYTIGQMHAMALGELYKRLGTIEKRIEEHERLHRLANQAAIQAGEMPVPGEKSDKPN
jgi:hypothetical protein